MASTLSMEQTDSHQEEETTATTTRRPPPPRGPLSKPKLLKITARLLFHQKKLDKKLDERSIFPFYQALLSLANDVSTSQESEDVEEGQELTANHEDETEEDNNTENIYNQLLKDIPQLSNMHEKPSMEQKEKFSKFWMKNQIVGKHVHLFLEEMEKLSRGELLGPPPANVIMNQQAHLISSSSSGKRKRSNDDKEQHQDVQILEEEEWQSSEEEDNDDGYGSLNKEANEKRKNRRGQQARRAIWEKKFGEKATHVVKGLKKKPKEKQVVAKADAPSSSSTSSKRKEIDMSLHPSWIAKQQMNRGVGILPSTGQKIVFGEEAKEPVVKGPEIATPKRAAPVKKQVKAEDEGLAASWAAIRSVKEEQQRLMKEVRGKKTVFE